MYHFFKLILINYFCLFLIFSPLFQTPAQAAVMATKEIAVVGLYKKDYPAGLDELRRQINQQLQKNKRIKIIPEKKLKNFFSQDDLLNVKELTAGDKKYLEAQEFFINHEFKKATESLEASIDILKQKPGVIGTLFKAYLLQVQLAWQLKKDNDALNAAKNAVLVNVAQNTLNGYFYSPKLEAYYEKVYKQVLKENKIVKMKIEVSSGHKDAIFVNGMKRGVGPALSVDVPEKIMQAVAVGAHSKSRVVFTQGAVVRLAGRAPTDEKQPIVMAFKASHYDQASIAAQNLGESLKLTHLILLSFDDVSSNDQVSLRLVDIANRRLVATQFFEMKKVSPQVLTQQLVAFVNAQTHTAVAQKKEKAPKVAKAVKIQKDKLQKSAPLLVKTEKKKSKTVLFVLGGIVLGGAALATALAAGGGGDNGLSQVQVSGSAPQF